MSKKPVSPLRQRLIDDMTARRYGEDTKGVIVDSSRKSTLSDTSTLPGWIILFDGRSGEHCLNCALEVAAAVDGP